MGADAMFVAKTIEPTSEQAYIQKAASNTIIIKANAGAAKTTTLALRIGEALACGVAPERILALTFTRPAVRAMRDALTKVGVPYEKSRRLGIHTFDTFAAKLLESIERKAVPSRERPEELAPFVWGAVKRLDLGVQVDIVESFLKASARLKGTLQRDRLLWESEPIDDDAAENMGVEPVLLRLFAAYENSRYPVRDGCDRPYFRAEFDATYDLARLIADPEMATRLSEIGAWPFDLQHLLVDEMHDLNFAAFTILRALLQTQPARFCGVGDFDQVVHQANGAERKFMEKGVDLGDERPIDFPPLTATRRFGVTLARAAGRLTNKKYSSETEHKTQIVCRAYADDGGLDCASRVAVVVREWIEQCKGNSPNLVILLRHSYQSVSIENELIRTSQPYEVLDGLTRYVMQPEVLLVRALLAVALGDYEQLKSKQTLRRLVVAVASFCGAGLSHRDDERESSQERLDEAIDYVTNDPSALGPFLEHQVLANGDPAMVKHMRAAIAVARSVRGSDMFDQFIDALSMKVLVATAFVEQQRRTDAIAYMDGLKQAARSFSTAKEFFVGLNKAETRGHSSNNAHKDALGDAKTRRQLVTLATVASVKGLEFDHVVLPFLSQDAFPAPLALSSTDERNLFYVGVTRARKALTLLVSEKNPSEFVSAAGFTVDRPSPAN